MIEERVAQPELAHRTLPAPHWEQTARGWEAQLGAARLLVRLAGGRYVPSVAVADTLYTEYGFGLRIWAMWRAEAIARAGGRGGVFP